MCRRFSARLDTAMGHALPCAQIANPRCTSSFRRYSDATRPPLHATRGRYRCSDAAPWRVWERASAATPSVQSIRNHTMYLTSVFGIWAPTRPISLTTRRRRYLALLPNCEVPVLSPRARPSHELGGRSRCAPTEVVALYRSNTQHTWPRHHGPESRRRCATTAPAPIDTARPSRRHRDARGLQRVGRLR